MFQSIIGSFVQAILDLLFWGWAHPVAASLTLSGMATTVLVWLHIPHRLTHYAKNGRMTVSQFDIRNELPRYVNGRIAVLRFCGQHQISLALGRKIRRTFLEFFLKVVGIPNPCDFSWDGGFAAIEVYPLGHSRLEYVKLCFTARVWPWKRAETLQRILKENDGYFPGFQEATFLAALTNRLYS